MTLSLYLTRVVAGRVLAVLTGFVLLGLSFDLLENSTDLIRTHGLDGVGQYALLRAPLILLTVFPLGVLFGATLAFFALAARNEMVVIRTAGVNTVSIVFRLIPLALLLGAAQNQLAARIGPAAEQALVERFPEFVDTPDVKSEVWLRDWKAVIRIGRTSANGSVLYDVSIFETAPDGELNRRIDAAVARYAGEDWQLTGVTVHRPDRKPETMSMLYWKSRLTPAGVVGAARQPDLVSSADVRRILSGERPGARGTPYYLVQLWRSYAAFLIPAVMVVFGALASFGLVRSGGGARHIALGVAAGTGFVLVNGVFSSLGQAGAMQAVLAAFIAPAVFFVLGLWTIVVIEE